MPIYEYSCRKCGGRVEAMQKITDKPLGKHAGCGGRLEKEWSRTGFQFKGTGWYVTDYAGRKAEAKGEGEAGGDSKEAGGDSKKEAAAEAKETKADAKEAKADAKSDAAAGAKKTSKPKASSKGARVD